MMRPMSSRPARERPAAAALSGQIAAQLAPWKARWRALAPRERRLIGAAGAVLAVFLLWSWAVAPALKTVGSAPLQRADMARDLSRMQALAREAQELRVLPVITPEQATQALRAATERLGPGAKLVLNAGQAQVTLGPVSPTALMSWLGEVRSAARARVVDMQLQRQGDTYQGSVLLTLSVST